MNKKGIIMKKSIKKVAGSVVVLAFALATILTPSISVSAANNSAIQEGADAAGSESGLVADLTGGDSSIFNSVVNAMLFIVGAVSVVMLIWGGIRYATSAGNSASVTAAKNTIMYAIVGLIISILAFALVNWVIAQFSK